MVLMDFSRVVTSSRSTIDDVSPSVIKRKLFKYDIAVSDTLQMPILIRRVSEQLKAEGYHILQDTDMPKDVTKKTSLYESSVACFQLFGFGHLGDGNLHLNIIMSAKTDNDFLEFVSTIYTVLDRIVYQQVVAMNGSFSAEHGVGRLKRHVMAMAKSEEELLTMQALKKSLDPKNILNPGKVFPQGYVSEGSKQ